MILTAYLDESGTHTGAKVSAMAEFVGNARQWRKYEKRTGSYLSATASRCFTPSMCAMATEILRIGRSIERSSFWTSFSTLSMTLLKVALSHSFGMKTTNTIRDCTGQEKRGETPSTPLC